MDGRSVVGLGNSELDLQLLIDDLNALAAIAGAPRLNLPTGLTAARGANDAMWLGLQMSQRYGPPDAGINDQLGFQRLPAWWTLAHKQRMYLDGSGDARGFRTMMAMLLAFGLTEAQVRAREPAIADIREYLLTLAPPPWPYDPVDADLAARGGAIFAAHCAGCHGDYENGVFPNRIVPAASVATDELRASRYGVAEVAWVNASWFGGSGDPPHAQQAQGGYLAPDLTGIWARAPYLHNGSVPTLHALLKPSARPRFFKRRGAAAASYDRAAVGWIVEVLDAGQVATDPRNVRDAIYDTTLPGLSNGGHPYGDDLSDEERTALLEYLKLL